MSIIKIKRAFEGSLKLFDPLMVTAYENVKFTPVTGVPYQKVKIVPRKPENPTLGDDFYREVGQCQIFLCYDSNEGTNAAYTKAENLKGYFKRGTSLSNDGINITVRDTPQIVGGTVTTDRYVVVVLIEYFADVLV